MNNVVRFPRASERHKGKTLCRNNHHKWQVDKQQIFDVKLGKLVTIYRCSRCGATKNRAI